MRVTVPAVLNIPEPRFVPQDDDTIHKAVRVVNATPRVLTEFDQRRRFILQESGFILTNIKRRHNRNANLCPPVSPPSFNLPFA